MPVARVVTLCGVDGASTDDPAEVVIAWEAVEDLLAPVPEGASKDVLRLVAAGLSAEEIADRLDVPVTEVGPLAARGRVRVLTAALDGSARRADRRASRVEGLPRRSGAAVGAPPASGSAQPLPTGVVPNSSVRRPTS